MFVNSPHGQAYTLNRKNRQGDSSSQIEITAMKKRTMDIMFYHSIHFMRDESVSVNFISWNKAYTVFPRFKFIDHAEWSLQEFKRMARWHKLKHFLAIEQAEGFPHEGIYKHVTRHVGDNLTWMIPFDTSRVTGPETLDYRSPYTCFQAYETYVKGRANEHGVYSTYEDVPSVCWVNQLYDPIARETIPARRERWQ